VDVEGVPPATDAGVGAASTRPDVVDATALAAAEDALGQVPDREGDFVRVPRVM
jgi:Asp-tRNA(Asn)/Glu-tRNA(Gln) amidotransferase C subunit